MMDLVDIELEEFCPDYRSHIERVHSDFNQFGIESLAQIRAACKADASALTAQNLNVGVKLEAVDTAHREAQKLYWLSPSGARAQNTPILIWIHGGGLVAGHPLESFCFKVVQCAGINVCSLGYSLSPCAPFPQALLECVSAVEYIYNVLRSQGVPAPKLILGGSSAGAGLAVAVMLHLRDHNKKYISASLLHYPMLECGHFSAASRRFWRYPVWDIHKANFAWASYLPLWAPNAQDEFDLAGLQKQYDISLKYATPSLEKDFSGFP